jgi:hypothetical protein
LSSPLVPQSLWSWNLSKGISLIKKGGYAMDTVTIIRVVAAVLFCVVLVVLIQRRRSRVH